MPHYTLNFTSYKNSPLNPVFFCLPATPPKTDMEAVAPSDPKKDERQINCQEHVSEDSSQICKGNGTVDSGVHSTAESVDHAYPYIPLFFIMANAVLQKLAVVASFPGCVMHGVYLYSRFFPVLS